MKISTISHVLVLTGLVLALNAGESHAVWPYQPVHPDPVLEP